jgi:hypothetical protein
MTENIDIYRVDISSDGVQTYLISKLFFKNPKWHAPPSHNHKGRSNIRGNLLCIRHQARRYAKSLAHARVVLWLHANLSTLVTCQVVENCTLPLHTLFHIQKTSRLGKTYA